MHLMTRISISQIEDVLQTDDHKILQPFKKFHTFCRNITSSLKSITINLYFVQFVQAKVVAYHYATS